MVIIRNNLSASSFYLTDMYRLMPIQHSGFLSGLKSQPRQLNLKVLLRTNVAWKLAEDNSLEKQVNSNLGGRKSLKYQNYQGVK